MIIDHINISAPQKLIEALKKFYCFLLEVDVGFRPAFKSQGYWLYHGDKPLIHLTVSETHRANSNGYLDHVAFQVVGLTKTMAKLDKLGLDYQAAHLSEIGMTQIFLKDPAGNGVELNFLAESD